MNRAFIEQLITKHEGRRSKVYADSLGILTIGIGWNLEDPQSEDICEHFSLNLNQLKNGTETLTDGQIDSVFSYQVTRTISDAASILPNLMTMPDNVSAAVIDMMFQLGLPRFSKFKKTVEALKAGNWKQAAFEAMDSKWAQQTPNRAKEDTDLMESA